MDRSLQIQDSAGVLGPFIRIARRPVLRSVPRPTTMSLLGVAGLLWLGVLTGCATRMGPATIPGARFDYNDKIARSQNDQLLLNLVRLRYRDTPVFLDVGTVIAQYSLSAQAGVAPTLNVDGVEGTELGLDLGGSYSEQPTITYEPLKGSEFTRRFLTPLSPVTIVLLSESGWSIERLLLCCVERINRVPNAPQASGPTPERLPDNTAFRELAGLLRQLQVADLLHFGAALGEEAGAASVRVERPADGDPAFAAWQRARELLGLRGDEDVFVLATRGLRQEPDEIALSSRSLLGVLFFLSHAVEAPADHEQRGLVTVTKGGDGAKVDWGVATENLLQIRSSASVPASAFVRIRYRGHWFYIDDADLHSKATFNLLTYLFSLQAAGEGEGSPLLTVPVGG